MVFRYGKMPRSTRAEIRASLERIEGILQEHPEGVQRAEIRDALNTQYNEGLADRTLRRWAIFCLSSREKRPGLLTPGAS